MREGFQFYLEICMADDGFVGRYEVVEPRRGNRRWPDDVKARFVSNLDRMQELALGAQGLLATMRQAQQLELSLATQNS